MSPNTPNLVIYNLGCGTRASALCTNVDWSIHLRLRKWGFARLAGSRRDAIVLGRKTNAVEAALHRTLRKLRDELEAPPAPRAIVLPEVTLAQ
jgi:hypothetical protein